ncbi:MAG: ergothioneine biosynthesis protein EgtB [Holophagales bacterium]|nr:ergothioneine biosynthesis protein EgtB [Holophagales bacterium]
MTSRTPTASEVGSAAPALETVSGDTPLSRYRAVRRFTEHLCGPLATEDYVVQSMPDASPTKWHLAHTTWFFEVFLLEPHLAGYEPADRTFHYLFNSYYNSLGRQYFRPERGLISRPTVQEVYDYRHRVDRGMESLLGGRSEEELGELRLLLEVGMAHEQQHQELLLTDLKHMMSKNPLFPVYRQEKGLEPREVGAALWHSFEGGLHEIGHEPCSSFAYDNEGPRHKVYLEPFELSSRLVTWGEYSEFMADGGYERPELWLSDGWAVVQNEGWRAPLYWLEEEDGSWSTFTLAGKRAVRPQEPACHLSFFEADAFARWAGARLPTEAEWEIAAERLLGRGKTRTEALARSNLADDEHFHPVPLAEGAEPFCQLLGDVWEWTRSAYSPYPGYVPPEGALGEYNSKFMNNQIVLRGGSCATHRSHIRTTYRNFFPASVRWQFSGLRLAKDGSGENGRRA